MSSAELELAGSALPRPWERAQLAASVAGLCLSLGTAIYCPALLFLALPLLFGVPHVAADLRHLVLRRDLPGAWRRTIWLGCGALLGLRALAAVHPFPQLADVETLFAVTWAMLAVRAGARREPARTPLAVGMVVAVGLAMLHYPRAVRLVLLHLHNMIALVAAGVLFRARSRAFLMAAAAIAVLTLVLASGAFWGVSVGAAASLHGSVLEMQLLDIADQIAPGLGPERSIGITGAFLFLQAVHYLIWLVVIPRQDRCSARVDAEAARPRPVLIGSWPARVLGSVQSALGSWRLAVLALASGAMIGAGLLQPWATRTLYLSLATFHVYLELVMLLYFWVARGRERLTTRGELACIS